MHASNRLPILRATEQGIKIIKLFAWERNFQQRIDRARDAELRDLSRFVYTRSIIIITWVRGRMRATAFRSGNVKSKAHKDAHGQQTSTDNTQDATPTLVALCTFLVHTLALGKPLTAAAGFAALSLFDLLRFPLVVLPGKVGNSSHSVLLRVLVFGSGQNHAPSSYLSQRSTHPPSPYDHQI